MRFTLVYQGSLPPNGSPEQKWQIRQQIEPQLRRLWDLPPFDSVAKYKDAAYRPDECYVGKQMGSIEYVPCISQRLKMRAELCIKLMSTTMPGGMVQSG